MKIQIEDIPANDIFSDDTTRRMRLDDISPDEFFKLSWWLEGKLKLRERELVCYTTMGQTNFIYLFDETLFDTVESLLIERKLTGL